MKNELLDELLYKVSKSFKTFGGGQCDNTNPLSRALKDESLKFALGVDVIEVIQFIEKFIKEKKIITR